LRHDGLCCGQLLSLLLRTSKIGLSKKWLHTVQKEMRQAVHRVYKSDFNYTQKVSDSPK
jgi:hypothetical protein